MLRHATDRRAMLVVAAAAAAVFAVAAAVALDTPRELDLRLVTWVAERRTAGLTHLSDTMATLGSAYVVTPVAVVAALLLIAFRRFREALFLALAMAAEAALNPTLKVLFTLPRPSGDLAVHQSESCGFPSGHAMAAATFSAVLAFAAWPTPWRRLLLVAGALWSVLMGLSRVYLGAHWPTDVIAGWAAGLVLAVGFAVIAGVGPARPIESRPEDTEGGARVAGAESRVAGAESRGAGAESRAAGAESPAAEPATPGEVRVVLFDWGNTLMVDDGQPGPMATWPRVAAVPGAAEALTALRGRYRLCVATNADDSGAAEVMTALARVDLARCFDRVFSSRDIGARKPAPAFYAAVLEALRADAAAAGEPPLGADQVVMVGDDFANDVAGARSAGLQAVWFRPDASADPETPSDAATEGDSLGAVRTIDDLARLPDLLSRVS